MAFADGHQMLVAIMAIPSGKDNGIRVVNGELEFRRDQSAIGWDIATDKEVGWDIATDKEVGTLVFDPFLLFKAISPDGRYAVLQQREQEVYDLTTGRKACTLSGSGHGFVFSQDSSTLVAFDPVHLCVWEIPTGRRSKHFVYKPEYGASYTSKGQLALSADKQVLAVSRFKGKCNLVGLISLESGKVVDEFESCPSGTISDVVVFSPVGRTLATDTYSFNSRDQFSPPLLRLWQAPSSW
jgi:hypothetical protein